MDTEKLGKVVTRLPVSAGAPQITARGVQVFKY